VTFVLPGCLINQMTIHRFLVSRQLLTDTEGAVYVELGFLLVVVLGIDFICDIPMFGRSGCMTGQIPQHPHTHMLTHTNVILKLSEASTRF
jgi:hypothetical protein